MFRKIVSNLAFSPALIGQLGFYAKRLRKEEASRRVGLVFTALALVVQSFAVFAPPEAANASSTNSFVSGGFSTRSEYLGYYDKNHNNIKDLFTALGITRSDIEKTTLGDFNSKDGVYSWGLNPHFSAAQGEHSYTVATSGGSRTFYYRPLYLWDTGSNVKYGSTYSAYIGKTSSGMWFALMKICGNLALKVVPPPLKCPTGTEGTYPNCTPIKMCEIPGKTTIRADDPNCKVTKMCTIPGKTQYPADDPRCVEDPIARCDKLTITPLIGKLYQFDARAYVNHGATVSGYTYVVKRNGKVVLTKKVTSTQSTDRYVYDSGDVAGDYVVELTVDTSLGPKSDSNLCAQTFHIAPPEMCPQNPKIRKDSPDCQPCPGDTTLWIKDEKCSANIIYTKLANNTTQNKDATQTQAQAGDKIVYTLNIQNTGKADSTVNAQENLADVTEYAELIDMGGGTYDAKTKQLTWPAVVIKPNEKQSRMFTVKLLDTIPSMSRGTDDKTSFDCRIDNTFGNTVKISVACPAPKEVEQTVAQLPHTGPRENMIFAGIVATIVTYFYARSRQMKKEVRLIRRDFNAGTI